MSYKPSGYWQELGQKCNQFLSELGYDNFKRTVGIVYNDYYFNYETKKLDDDYEDKVRIIWDKMYENFPEKFLDSFHEPLEGNPLGTVYRGRFVSIDLASSICEYAMIVSNMDISSIKSITEIGGGYGRLAYLITQIHPDIKYRMFDIEPSISLAKRYLTKVSPLANIEYYTPDKLGGKTDLLVAMDCLHEMTKEQVDTYFDYADKFAKYFYFTCWKSTEVVRHGIKWNREDYPVKSNWTELFNGQHKMRTDFFEGVYKI